MRLRRYLSLALVAAACSVPARATQTDPVLAIVTAQATSSVSGTLIQIDAAYPAADMIQQAVPVQVLLRNLLGGGTAYVRFALGDDVYAGSDDALADGLDPADVAGLLAGGTPLAGARLLHFGTQRLELWLPGLVAAGTTEVQLFLVYQGDPILSNAAPLEGVAP